MVSEDRQSIIEGLLSLPFPQKATRAGHRSSGPGHHMRVLQASHDFWEDRSEEAVEAAEEEIETAFRELVSVLTARWGGPETIDLGPCLWSEAPAPEPMDHLCLLSGQMLLWRRPEFGRWVALAVGQADREFPVELLVATGDAPVP